MNLSGINKRFRNEKDALEHLAKVRWGDKVICPYCNTDRVTYMAGQFRYHCNAENRSFSVRAVTIFEGTRLDIRKWFYALALMLNTKKGLSAMQFHRDAGVTYKTAWYCLMRIRCALTDQEEFLHSVVQAGNVFTGNKKNKSASGTPRREDKVMAEPRRKRKVIAEKVPGLVSQQLTELLKKIIVKKQAVFVKDKHRGYNKLDQFFNQITIKHSGEFSKQGINLHEAGGFTSLLKKGLAGQYHKISMKYLPFYLAEFTFRYNHNLDKKFWNMAIELSIEKNKCMLRYKYKHGKSVKVCEI